MTNVEKLNKYLSENNLAITRVYVHPDAETKAEEVAGEILKSLTSADFEELHLD